MNKEPTPEERDRMIKDALAELRKNSPDYTVEERLVERAREVALEVNAVFQGMLETNVVLMVSKKLQREELAQLFADRLRSKFDKEELVFICTMLQVEAIIDQY